MNRAVIDIGSNIEPEANVAAALVQIALDHRVLAQSRLVRTAPIGKPTHGDIPDSQGDVLEDHGRVPQAPGGSQPEFLNGTVLIETELDRQALRAWLKELENRLGRLRTTDKFAPRTIDLDIVVWNGQIVDEDVRTRDFLRAAVLEVLPELRM